MNVAIVKNPHDGRLYNIAPLFRYMNDFEDDFESLANQLEQAGEMITYLLEGEDFGPLDIKNAAQTVNNLKRVFRKINILEL